MQIQIITGSILVVLGTDTTQWDMKKLISRIRPLRMASGGHIQCFAQLISALHYIYRIWNNWQFIPIIAIPSPSNYTTDDVWTSMGWAFASPTYVAVVARKGKEGFLCTQLSRRGSTGTMASKKGVVEKSALCVQVKSMEDSMHFHKNGQLEYIFNQSSSTYKVWWYVCVQSLWGKCEAVFEKEG